MRWRIRWDQFQYPVVNFRPQLPDTYPILEKTLSQGKRNRATPKKKFRPATPKAAAVHPPFPEAPPKPKTKILSPSVPVRESTPWPGAGKMSGDLFDDRNWLIPQSYIPNKDKDENATGITSPRPPNKRKWTKDK